MKIKELCARVEEATGKRCTPAMVKNYEKVGLISAPPRSPGGTRLYSGDYVNRISRIVELKTSFLRLEAIKEILEDEAAAPPHEEKDLGFESSLLGQGNDVDSPLLTRIVDGALFLFTTRGYHNTKISDVARNVGCGSGTIYTYFSSKKDLLFAVVDRITSTMESFFKQIDDIETDPIERTKLIGLTHLRINEDIKDIIFFLQAETIDEDMDFARKADEVFKRYTDKVRENISDAVAQGLSRDIDAMVLSYGLLGLIPMIAYGLRHDRRYTPEVIIDTVADILLEGLRPR